MRYTTLIDLREWPELYRNSSIRLLYLHMVLASGYHDHDRDVLRTSIRRLEADCGLTMSAVRNGLRQLEKYKLIVRMKEGWYVRKFIPEQKISRREKTAKEVRDEQLAQARREEKRRDDEQRRQRLLDEQRERTEGEPRFRGQYEAWLKKPDSDARRQWLEREKEHYESLTGTTVKLPWKQ